MTMKGFLIDYLRKHPQSLISSDRSEYTYEEFLNEAETQSKRLNVIAPYKAKCIIYCKDELNTAILLCSCFLSEKIPIIISYHYGRIQYDNIMDFIEADLLLTDAHGELQIEKIEAIPKKIELQSIQSEPEIQDVAIIMCTSGTTGKPKGVMHTASSIQKNIFEIKNYLKTNNHDTILISRPLYHCAALIGEFLTAICSGSNIVFCNQIFSPAEIIKKSIRHNITVLCTTPTMMKGLSSFVLRGDYNLNIQTVTVSGECLSRNTAEFIRKAFPDARIFNAYGLTEAGPRVSYLPCELFDKYCESAGIPLNDVKIKIVDRNFEEVSKGVKGLVMVHTPSVMKGYYRNKNLSETILKQDGWLATGDIGYFDNQGLLYISSRADDMIIKCGMNIYPQEIENLLCGAEEIKECMAYGELKNDTQIITIDVVLNKKYKTISEKELMIIASKKLPAYQMPSRIQIVNELKKGSTGKLIRRK